MTDFVESPAEQFQSIAPAKIDRAAPIMMRIQQGLGSSQQAEILRCARRQTSDCNRDVFENG